MNTILEHFAFQNIYQMIETITKKMVSTDRWMKCTNEEAARTNVTFGINLQTKKLSSASANRWSV